MSSYSDFADSASRILEHKGDVLAQGKARSGELIGSTIGTLGNQIPQQVQAVIKQRAAARKHQQITDIFAGDGDLPGKIQQVYAIDPEMGSKLGKEYGEAQKTTYELAKLKHEYESKKLDVALNTLGSAKDDATWAHGLLGLKEAGEDVTAYPLQYSPEAAQQVNRQLLTAKERIALDAPKPPKADYTIGDKRFSGETNEVLATGGLTDEQRAVNARLEAAANAQAANTTADNARADAAQKNAEASRAEQARHNKAMEARPVGGSTSVGSLSDVKETIQGMKEGTIPPQLPGRASKEYTAMMAEAHRQGYDLAGAVTDWTATQKHIATLNGAQQTRMAQAIDNAAHSLDVIDTLADQWNGGKFPLLNKAILASAKNGALGAQAQQIATNLDAQIADVTSELGNVYMGGNSPTDHALGLAAKNLSADWTRDQLKAATKLARQNLIIRQNSIKNAGVAGASATNPYAPQPQPATAPAPAPATTPTRGAVSGRVGPYTYVVK